MKSAVSVIRSIFDSYHFQTEKAFDRYRQVSTNCSNLCAIANVARHLLPSCNQSGYAGPRGTEVLCQSARMNVCLYGSRR